jgi:hypothetical protein
MFELAVFAGGTLTESRSSSESSRRRFLRASVATTATLGSSALSGCVSIFFPRFTRLELPDLDFPEVGSIGDLPEKKRPEGAIKKNYDPVNFSSHRNRIKKKEADHVVKDKSELINALKHPKTIIWIPGDVTIDMTKENPGISIAPDVTIASNRSIDGAKGGMVKSNAYDVGIFENGSKDGGLRVTGVRVKGPRTDIFDPRESGEDPDDYAAMCFHAYGKYLVVDNCEVFGWTFAGFAPGSGDPYVPTPGWFHHNEMHHNQMVGYGYPMELYNGEHLIEWNYFDSNRHSIAGFGYPDNGYEARFNIIGPHAEHDYFFSFDMHSIKENLGKDQIENHGFNPKRAGKYVNVHHNVFELTEHNALSISGNPKKHSRFCQNWCAGQKKEGEGGVVSPPDNTKLLRMKNNVYGEKAIKQGRKWLKNLKAEIEKREGGFPGSTQPASSEMLVNLDIGKPPNLSTKENASRGNRKRDVVNPLTEAPLTPVSGEQ